MSDPRTEILKVLCRDCGVEHSFRVYPGASGVIFACNACGSRRMGRIVSRETRKDLVK